MATEDTATVTQDDVYEALEEVIDPELGLDFVSLGLVYDVEIEDTDVYVTFTLTYPGCPIGPQVSEQIKEFVGGLEGVERRPPEDGLRPALDPGHDVRGRQVRARLLGCKPGGCRETGSRMGPEPSPQTARLRRRGSHRSPPRCTASEGPSSGVGASYTRRSSTSGIREFFRDVAQSWETFRFEATDLRDLGDRVLVLGDVRGRGRAERRRG